MTARLIYECRECGKIVETNPEKVSVPECCHKPMQKVEPLDACQKSTTAEHSRLDDFGDACDDGRSGKI